MRWAVSTCSGLLESPLLQLGNLGECTITQVVNFKTAEDKTIQQRTKEGTVIVIRSNLIDLHYIGTALPFIHTQEERLASASWDSGRKKEELRALQQELQGVCPICALCILLWHQECSQAVLDHNLVSIGSLYVLASLHQCSWTESSSSPAAPTMAALSSFHQQCFIVFIVVRAASNCENQDWTEEAWEMIGRWASWLNSIDLGF